MTAAAGREVPVIGPAGVPTTSVRLGAPGELPARSEVRLRMKGRPATHGPDGAWWPRTLDPAAEFPELVLVISSWVGPVARVVYRVDDWDVAGAAATSDGWPFDLQASDTLEPGTVTVVGTHQRRRTLVVVPPGTPGGVARAVLSSSAGPRAMESAEQVLADHGIRPRPHGAVDGPPAHR